MKRTHTLMATAALATLTVPPLAAAADYDVIALPGGRNVVVPAFRTYMATGYAPSEKNMAFLKGLKDKAPAPRLVAFDTAKNNKAMLLCRASFPVYGPNKTPFASLMEAAANLELVASGLVEPDAPRIQASLDEFDFSSFGGGKWSINATFTVQGKPPFTVKSVHSFPVSAGAVNGCGDVMNALPAGIEAFLMKLYSDPAFLDAMQAAAAN
ncbi:hypothetical protein ASC95_08700 [Pelomonas sp. Root1217]|uniref:hypothetical protein n=1 Tax=Pelomonas sp. Root1217 TaxID=1736430 RepID=UPI0007122EE2|nr:hypothetical protein [Pelomonas sp. Root1217]KQV52867.1 hypothetical protein ASC95_08700 [Pelomonas sp. Root1217]